MVQTELLDEIYREPFIPLRLHLSNGHTVDLFNPGVVWVTKHSLFIAHPIQPGSRGIDDYDLISLVHIVRVEKIARGTPPSRRRRRKAG